MRLETTVRALYTFDELPEDVQEKALDKLYDLNIYHDWWDFIYDEITDLGLKCNGFDIDRGSYCKLKFVDNPCNVAETILSEHGKSCDTYKTAERFLTAWKGFNDDDDENRDDAVDDFLRDLSEDYLSILRKEYEYRVSREAIIEAIKANEYEFDEAGNLA